MQVNAKLEEKDKALQNVSTNYAKEISIFWYYLNFYFLMIYKYILITKSKSILLQRACFT